MWVRACVRAAVPRANCRQPRVCVGPQPTVARRRAASALAPPHLHRCCPRAAARPWVLGEACGRPGRMRAADRRRGARRPGVEARTPGATKPPWRPAPTSCPRRSRRCFWPPPPPRSRSTSRRLRSQCCPLGWIASACAPTRAPCTSRPARRSSAPVRAARALVLTAARAPIALPTPTRRGTDDARMDFPYAFSFRANDSSVSLYGLGDAAHVLFDVGQFDLAPDAAACFAALVNGFQNASTGDFAVQPFEAALGGFMLARAAGGSPKRTLSSHIACAHHRVSRRSSERSHRCSQATARPRCASPTRRRCTRARRCSS